MKSGFADGVSNGNPYSNPYLFSYLIPTLEVGISFWGAGQSDNEDESGIV